MFKDGHHVIHSRVDWSTRPESKRIRDTPSLIVRMDRELHNEIHRKCPAIPLLGYHALVRTLSTFEQGDNPLESIDNLMSAMEATTKHPKSHRVESELTRLAVHAIDLQRPFIQSA